ncbi:PAS domain-containing sensor histidine kinase [Desulfogranum mediterraneum]|uniref:PAS domain-containing sensor histidine kinase n=1 Tax=Desulfogranum mediterraneum TaxID=160661 RepID=UPI00041C9364|nr:PAS domain S-box protein [Desulfogranum mediterraneum]
MFFVFFLVGSVLASFYLYLEVLHSRQHRELLLEGLRLRVEYPHTQPLLQHEQEAMAAIIGRVGRLPGVEEVGLRREGRGEMELGRGDGRSIQRRSIPLWYPDGDLQDLQVPLGALTLGVEAADFSGILAQSGLKMISIVLILSMVAALLLFGLFQLLVGRHLARVASYSSSLDLSNLETALVLERGLGKRADELDHVVAALNTMRCTLKKSLALLREKEREFEAIVTHSSDAITRFDEQCRRIYANPVACDRLGLPLEKVVGRTQEELGLCRTISQRIDMGIAEVFICGARRRVSYETETPAGARCFELLLAPELSCTGEVMSVIGISRDTTERSKREAFLREAFSRLPVFVSISEIESGRFLEVNDTLLRFSGYSKEELIGRSSVELGYVSAADRQRMRMVLEREGCFEDLELEIYKADGTRVTCLYFGELIEVNGSAKFLALGLDISEKKRIEQDRTNLERQLHQALKMEAIGTLAGGIAHDFNNILTAILGFAQIMRVKLPAESPLCDEVRQILQAGNRAADLIRQILTFSRQGQEALRPILLQPIVTEAVKLLRSTLPATIELEVELGSDCGAVLADANQIHQVLLSICTNAHQAIGNDYGQISIGLREITVDQEIYGVDGKAIESGRYLELAVGDSGPGISPELRKRIFDPFFTTKGPVQGTGLGLSVTLGIVSKHNGTIVVSSEPGEGTAMKIYLPVDENALQEGEAGAP